jgi:hypothetical protein
MDHVEVRQWLTDALAGGVLPSVLDDLAAAPGSDGASPDPTADEVRAHLMACDACEAEAGALVTTGALLAAATPDDVLAPVAARERILRTVRETGMVRVPAAPTPAPVAVGVPVGPAVPAASRLRRWRLVPALASVAMAAIIVGGLFTVANMGHQRDVAQAEVAALGELASASGHILARPDHAQLALVAADGTSMGMVVFSPSSGQLAVWSRDLVGMASGTRYDCFLVRGSSLTLIGWMDTAGDVAYWVGQSPAGVTLGHAGDRIVVQADVPGAAPVLSGTF